MIGKLFKFAFYLACVLVGWWGSILINAYLEADPKAWLTVERLHVYDSVEGLAPRIDLQRTIHQPFRGTWLVEVGIRDKDGFAARCQATGSNYYRPRDTLPSNLDLDWFTYPVKCALTPGEYILDTIWTIRPIDQNPMEVAKTSNVFTIRSR